MPAVFGQESQDFRAGSGEAFSAKQGGVATGFPDEGRREKIRDGIAAHLREHLANGRIELQCERGQISVLGNRDAVETEITWCKIRDSGAAGGRIDGCDGYGVTVSDAAAAERVGNGFCHTARGRLGGAREHADVIGPGLQRTARAGCGKKAATRLVNAVEVSHHAGEICRLCPTGP